MRDFSEKYRGVVHFGLWAEQGADRRGDADAWAILGDAAQRCSAEDISQEPGVLDALAWFEKRLVRPRPVADIRKAFTICDPMERHYAMDDAVKRIRRYIEF